MNFKMRLAYGILVLTLCALVSFGTYKVGKSNTPIPAAIKYTPLNAYEDVSKTYKSPPESYYRLYLYDDSMTLMDGDRVVVRLAYDSSLLSKTVLKDNE